MRAKHGLATRKEGKEWGGTSYGEFRGPPVIGDRRKGNEVEDPERPSNSCTASLNRVFLQVQLGGGTWLQK